ncbi:MAG: hypothetical protein Q8M08_02560 [Bacteroidales bacterium]|nr:hypothetical protein [Bacteroidales bacterium]
MKLELSNSFLDRVLPTYGKQRENIPIYDNTQKMFLSNTYTSESGNMYYKGLRFSERLVMVEHVGLYKNWTYIDEVEIYAFDGNQMTLIGKKKFDKQFYNPETIKNEVTELTFDFLKTQMSLSGGAGTDESLKALAIEIVEDTYQNPIENIKRLPESTRLMLN